MTVSDYIFDYLSEYVDTVFFLPGGGCMHLVDALARQSKIKPVACLTEYDASRAVLGYAMAKNDLGVVLVTTGPGATNAITACAAASVDYVPMLFLSGQVPTHLIKDRTERQCGPQEVDIVSMVSSVCKVAMTPLQPLGVKNMLPWAVETALGTPRGPVWLDIPLDVQGVPIG